jgi:hypothetical protein
MCVFFWAFIIAFCVLMGLWWYLCCSETPNPVVYSVFVGLIITMIVVWFCVTPILFGA